MSLPPVIVAAEVNLPNFFTAKNQPGVINPRVLNVATNAITVIYLNAKEPTAIKKTPNTKTARVPTEQNGATAVIKALNAKNSDAVNHRF